MLDTLYENIGGKIKNWAKWIFVIEAIAAAIVGLVMMLGDIGDDAIIWWGLLVLAGGPCVALVSTWLLYAFGELVEDVHAMRNKEGTTAEEAAKREAEAKRQAEEKAKRQAEENAKREAEEMARREAEKTVPNGKKCELCGEYFEHLTLCKIKDDFGTRYRNICDECVRKNNATTKR
jgi:hypothetical protein